MTQEQIQFDLPGDRLDILAAMNAHIESLRDQKDRTGKVYPSDLGGESCRRAYWLRYHGEPARPSTPGELLMYKMGDLVHDFIQGVLEQVMPGFGWDVIGIEYRVKHLGLSGRIDLLLRNRVTGELAVIDIKTKRGGAFQYMDEANPNDVAQLQWYADAVGAKVAFLVYVDREGQNFCRIREVTPDKSNVLKEMATIENMLADDEPGSVGLKLTRNENKGPKDSLYLKVPWQINWCTLNWCRCKKELPGMPPKTVIAHLVKKTGEIVPTKGNEKWVPVIKGLMR